MAENGFDKFLSDTSGMGPVPNARSGNKNKNKKRARAAGDKKSRSAVGRNKPNKYVAPKGGGFGGGGRP